MSSRLQDTHEEEEFQKDWNEDDELNIYTQNCNYDNDDVALTRDMCQPRIDKWIPDWQHDASGPETVISDSVTRYPGCIREYYSQTTKIILDFKI